MKKTNVLAASLFIAALVVGMSFVGSFTQAQASPVTCSVGSISGPITETITTASVSLFASGGSGTYAWSSPNFQVPVQTGNSGRLDLTFRVPGNYSFTVVSSGSTATCVVNVPVTAIESPEPGFVGGVEAPAPGLPNTGELPA